MKCTDDLPPQSLSQWLLVQRPETSSLGEFCYIFFLMKARVASVAHRLLRCFLFSAESFYFGQWYLSYGEGSWKNDVPKP